MHCRRVLLLLVRFYFIIQEVVNFNQASRTLAFTSKEGFLF